MFAEMQNAMKTRNGAALAVAIVFLLSAQILLSLHSAKFGDEPHDHGGQVCVLSLATSDTGKFLTPASAVIVIFFALWRLSPQITQTERALISIRAAQPRGPPSH